MVWISLAGLLVCVILLSIKLDAMENRMYQIKDARVNRENQLDMAFSNVLKLLRQRVHKLERNTLVRDRILQDEINDVKS